MLGPVGRFLMLDDRRPHAYVLAHPAPAAQPPSPVLPHVLPETAPGFAELYLVHLPLLLAEPSGGQGA
ncbi:hypothetical protein ACQYWQ_03835 [Streptomyces sp. P6-2-1]|uniref:hypothetical protein n=1 Tax=unclassified Streptomyces TaxID=2593676 RepID=UPI003D36B447